MTHVLKPYPARKDSGLEWLGEVPEHWEIQRLKNVAEMRISNIDKHTKEGEYPVRLCNYVDVYKNDHISPSMLFMRATATADEIARFRLTPGDVLITKDSEAWDDIGVPALVVESADDLVSGYHLALLRPLGTCLNGGYLLRALQSRSIGCQFHVQAKGVTRYGLSHAAIQSVWLPLPPLPEQAAISYFVDYVDRRIQRYIRAQQQLIALLEEYRQAIIHQAVTGQVDVRTGQPYPAYKDSRVGWLKEVPDHWDVIGLGRLICLTVGFPFKSDGFTQSDNDIRLLRGVNISPGRIRWNNVVRWKEADVDTFAEYRLEVGDIVLGMDRPIIGGGVRVAVVAQSDVPSLLLQRVARIRPKKTLLRGFALKLLGGNSFSDYLAPIFTGISVPHLSPDQIKEFRLALPSMTEQSVIVEHLDSKMRAVQSVLNGTEREIELLSEYRTRLIADVVTGKLDVREAAAALPEVDPLARGDVDDPLDPDVDSVLENLESRTEVII